MKRTSEYYITKVFHLVVNSLAVLIFVCCLAYAGYAIWDNFAVSHEPEAMRKELIPYKPTEVEDLAYSFNQLLKMNADMCGWITIDKTKIDYPIVQGKDNFEYLDKNVLGETSASGSIFLDYQNSEDFTDFYSILMGHHMQGGQMFGDLEQYTDEKFFTENHTGTLYLPNKILNLEMIAFLSVDAYDNYLYRTDWESEESRRELVSYINQNASYRRSGSLTEKDRMVALSTCASGRTNARYLLICKVSGESNIESSDGLTNKNKLGGR